MPKRRGEIVYTGHRSLPRRREPPWVGRGEKHFKIFFPKSTLHLTWRPWKGMYLLARTRTADGADLNNWADFWWRLCEVKKRQPMLPGSLPRNLAMLASQYFLNHPAVIEHCAIRQYDDGTPRETGFLLLKTVGPAWNITAKDPDTDTFLTAVGESIDGALDTLQLLLGSDNAPWEADTWARDRRSGKGKKGS